MTLTQFFIAVIPGLGATSEVVPVVDADDKAAPEVAETTEATTAPKVLDPMIAAHEAALTRAQALLATGMVRGGRRYI